MICRLRLTFIHNTVYAPMEVPETYDTYVESVQGDGRVYVFVHMDGSVDAYFGSPEKTIGYYVAVTGLDTD